MFFWVIPFQASELLDRIAQLEAQVSDRILAVQWVSPVKWLEKCLGCWAKV